MPPIAISREVVALMSASQPVPIASPVEVISFGVSSVSDRAPIFTPVTTLATLAVVTAAKASISITL